MLRLVPSFLSEEHVADSVCDGVKQSHAECSAEVFDMEAADELGLTDGEEDDGVKNKPCNETCQAQCQKVERKGQDAEEEKCRANESLSQSEQKDNSRCCPKSTDFHPVTVNPFRQQEKSQCVPYKAISKAADRVHFPSPQVSDSKLLSKSETTALGESKWQRFFWNAATLPTNCPFENTTAQATKNFGTCQSQTCIPQRG